MTCEAAPIDISTMPDLAQLVREVERTRTPRRLEEDGKAVALLVPAGGTGRQTKSVQHVDTSALPPVPYRRVDDMLASRPPWPGRAFTEEENKAALEEDRVDAWRRKTS